jgi:hypothetical protein
VRISTQYNGIYKMLKANSTERACDAHGGGYIDKTIRPDGIPMSVLTACRERRRSVFSISKLNYCLAGERISQENQQVRVVIKSGADGTSRSYRSGRPPA